MTYYTPFGTTKTGEMVYCLTIEKNGAAANIITYGAALQSLILPNRRGLLTDVCLGYDTLADYEKQDGCLGGIVGRCAGRIYDAKADIFGSVHMLSRNRPTGHIHGGFVGYHHRNWSFQLEEDAVTLSLHDPDGTEGYPGTACVHIRYALSDANRFSISYDAYADKDTIFNLTNHAYWNPNGHASGLEHNFSVQVYSNRMASPNKDGYPADYAVDVAELCDLRAKKDLNAIIKGMASHGLNGLDHTYLLESSGMKHAASLFGNDLRLDFYTDFPAIHLYTANYLSDRNGKSGAHYQKQNSICLETMFVPNAVNLSCFQKPLFRAGKHFQFELCIKYE